MTDYNQTGLLKCARYSFAPNQLHYCGPEKQADMKAYVLQSLADGGLGEILNKFDTLYKYIVFIASENKIRDPFDPRVVEAYWLGNNLLETKNIRRLATHFIDTLELKKKLSRKELGKLMMKLDNGFPHHTFHVLNIYRRTGHLPISHTLETMDNCRIGWGRVIEKEIKITKESRNNYLYISAPILIREGDKLKLGHPVKKKVVSLFKNINNGDWISFHWGVVCEKINLMQKQNLIHYTQAAIKLANS